MSDRDARKIPYDLRTSLRPGPEESRRLLSWPVHHVRRSQSITTTIASVRVLSAELMWHLTANDIESLGPRGLIHAVHLLEHSVVTDALQHVFSVPPAPLVHEASPDAHGEGTDPAGNRNTNGGRNRKVSLGTSRVTALLVRCRRTGAARGDVSRVGPGGRRSGSGSG